MTDRLAHSSMVLALSVVLGACDAPQPTVNPEEQAAADQARRAEEQRLAVEQERSDYQAKVAAAKVALEAEPTVANLRAFDHAVLEFGDLSVEARAELDYTTVYREVTLEGLGKQILDQVRAEWSDKKNRTTELGWDLKQVAVFRLNARATCKIAPSEWTEDVAQMLATGPTHDPTWAIGRPVHDVDVAFLELVFDYGGTQADVRTSCRAGLDMVIAEDKKDKLRQSYVLQTCSEVAGKDWQTDLEQWATAKEIKAFRKVYDPIRAEQDAAKAAENAAIQAKLDADWEAEKERRRAEDAASDAAWASGGSGSSGSSTSSSSSSAQGPVSVTLRNTCGSTIKLFYGDDPEFGSGRTDSLGSNSRTNMQFKVGEVVWLTDDARKGLASASVSSSTRELEFTCNSIRAR